MEFNQPDSTVYFNNTNTFLLSVKQATRRLVAHDLAQFDGVLETAGSIFLLHKGTHYNRANRKKRCISIYKTF
jgi:hypothetical protein